MAFMRVHWVWKGFPWEPGILWAYEMSKPSGPRGHNWTINREEENAKKTRKDPLRGVTTDSGKQSRKKIQNSLDTEFKRKGQEREFNPSWGKPYGKKRKPKPHPKTISGRGHAIPK